VGIVPLQSREESEALRINGARLHFLLLCPQVENVLFLTKWSLAPFFLPFFLGQNQRVLEIPTLAYFAFRHKKEDVCGISFCIYTVQFLCYRLGRKI